MAGYRSVIATMWAVGDSDAPVVAQGVYKRLFTDGAVNSGTSGLALYHAMRELREKVGEKNFLSWVPFIHVGA